MAVGDVYNLRLESIAVGGDALGRLDGGKPVFVEGGAPEETACCRITEEHKTWDRAELLEIIEASPVRIDSICKNNKECGGCNLLHISYEAQLAAKAAILKDSFLRIGGINAPEPEIAPSPPLEYRNRMQFHCLRERGKSDGHKFGLKGRKSDCVAAVSDCPVAESGIRELLREGWKTLALPPEKDRFTVFSKDGLLLSEGGTERGKITLLEKEITLDAGVFFKSNVVMLEKLILELLKTADSADKSLSFADLYCGVGTFAFFLGDIFAKIIAAEENKKAVAIARENLKGKNAEFFALRDGEWEKAFLRRTGDFGFAVIDPPRAGLAPKTAQILAREGPPLLAYVSCDAAALARDSKTLVAGGYTLKELKLFDFYPQTAHIESLAVFIK
jgi:23S rRNA (uracil1939-C5)-methyltransferase